MKNVFLSFILFIFGCTKSELQTFEKKGGAPQVEFREIFECDTLITLEDTLLGTSHNYIINNINHIQGDIYQIDIQLEGIYCEAYLYTFWSQGWYKTNPPSIDINLEFCGYGADTCNYGTLQYALYLDIGNLGDSTLIKIEGIVI